MLTSLQTSPAASASDSPQESPATHRRSRSLASLLLAETCYHTSDTPLRLDGIVRPAPVVPATLPKAAVSKVSETRTRRALPRFEQRKLLFLFVLSLASLVMRSLVYLLAITGAVSALPSLVERQGESSRPNSFRVALMFSLIRMQPPSFVAVEQGQSRLVSVVHLSSSQCRADLRRSWRTLCSMLLRLPRRDHVHQNRCHCLQLLLLPRWSQVLHQLLRVS